MAATLSDRDPDNGGGRSATSAAVPAPPRGVPFGLVLGPILVLVVCIVLGALSHLEQRREIRQERTDRQDLLEQSLAPLAEELETATTTADIKALVTRAHHAYTDRGLPTHWLRIEDATGRLVAEASPMPPAAPPEGSLVASIPVASSLLDGGAGTLTVVKDASRLAADVRERWRMWWLDLVVTSAALILAVGITVHLLLGRPLRRLVKAMRRLEHGHLGDWDAGAGAWEIRWLAWYFHRLSVELADSARRLVAAERRALEASRQDVVDHHRTAPIHLPARSRNAPEQHVGASLLAVRYLHDTCHLLETLRPGDPLAREVASDAWTQGVVEAERLGEMDLKARLEDGALRLLEPTAYFRVVNSLTSLRRARSAWVREVCDRLHGLVVDQGVPVVEIQQRVKHAAGVWRKMEERHLELEEIPDLFAFRIVVPDEPHCYLALAAVHQAFEPEPFRFKDYIAEPKPNGYRSLHTSVHDSAGRVFEVQIRTPQMHQEAERGTAAHWRYRAERWSRPAARALPRLWRRLTFLGSSPNR